MSFIIDASVAAAWCFEDEATPFTDSLLSRAEIDGIIVPAIWRFEMANLIRSAERRQRITPDVGSAKLLALAELVIHEDQGDITRCWIEVLALARRHTLTSYDAAYLELAKRMELPLASFDQSLSAAALAEGVEVLVKTPPL